MSFAWNGSNRWTRHCDNLTPSSNLLTKSREKIDKIVRLPCKSHQIGELIFKKSDTLLVEVSFVDMPVTLM